MPQSKSNSDTSCLYRFDSFVDYESCLLREKRWAFECFHRGRCFLRSSNRCRWGLIRGKQRKRENRRERTRSRQNEIPSSCCPSCCCRPLFALPRKRKTPKKGKDAFYREKVSCWLWEPITRWWGVARGSVGRERAAGEASASL
jgi:hypothetical protein